LDLKNRAYARARVVVRSYDGLCLLRKDRIQLTPPLQYIQRPDARPRSPLPKEIVPNLPPGIEYAAQPTESQLLFIVPTKQRLALCRARSRSVLISPSCESPQREVHSSVPSQLVRDFLGHAVCFDSEFNDSAHRAIAARGYRGISLARLPGGGYFPITLVLNA